MPAMHNSNCIPRLRLKLLALQMQPLCQADQPAVGQPPRRRQSRLAAAAHVRTLSIVHLTKKPASLYGP